LLSTAAPRADLAQTIEQLLDVASYSITEELLPDAAPAGPGPEVREAEPGLPSMIRIPTASLDRFLDTLGELITWRGSLGASLRTAVPDLNAATESHRRLSRAIDQLREEVMAIRLLPFEHLVPHLNQTVRSLCRSTGKRVALQISGTEVALDRAVLEEILDPLNHLLRNAVDHGIEPAAEREAAGKEPTGRILVAVTREGDRVHIRLEDDGRGIDTDRVLREAIQGGFISPTQAVPLSPEEILMLTTIPGFSTADRTTEISGRGVGMDVVRTRVENLNGRIVLRSTPGQGLVVLMDLPLTVAVIEAFLVEAAGVVFAVPASVAERTILASAASVRRSRSGFFLEDGERLLPAFRPDEALGLSPAERELPESFPAIVFSSGETRGALAVDTILERRELVVKPLGSPLEHLREYSGAALLDDGRIALILDVPNLAHVMAGA
ncbi:MAG TPA: ATP-binding protein, partial [Candidatus Saccharimonadales bacterium]|nr:ATP-binding protein [Candidatus Saccharimonadales bacterium]